MVAVGRQRLVEPVAAHAHPPGQFAHVLRACVGRSRRGRARCVDIGAEPFLLRVRHQHAPLSGHQRHCRLSCQVTPKRSPTQPNRVLNP